MCLAFRTIFVQAVRSLDQGYHPGEVGKEMKTSFKLGTISGIEIRAHVTFVILLAWLLLFGTGAGFGAFGGVGLVLMLFGIVVLHELGHALTARRFGIATRDITLWPMGGIAGLTRMPDEPARELAIALAGPAVNVALAGFFGLVYAILNTRGMSITGPTPVSLFLLQMIGINTALAVFNLLPAFPMDGGRVLRSFLALRMDKVKATGYAVKVGKVMAVLFAIVGLRISHPILVLIAVFVWFAGSAELKQLKLREWMRRAGMGHSFSGAASNRTQPSAVRYVPSPEDDVSDADYTEYTGVRSGVRDRYSRGSADPWFGHGTRPGFRW